MAYLNDVKLVSYLAIVPEMALSKSGRQYCNFTIKMLYRTPLGDPHEEYLMVTAYDTDAEYVVRECKKGDLLMIVGYLAQYKWEFDGKPMAKVMVIANSVELLARGVGMVPKASKEDLAFANPLPYADGEDGHVSSIAIRNKPTANQVSHAKIYPQPQANGQWKIPTGNPNQATKAWMESRGMVKPNTEISFQAIREYMCLPGLPDGTINKAKLIIPDNIKPNKGGYIKMPDGKFIPLRNYENITNAQSKMLGSMTPTERETVLSIASRFFGVTIEYQSPDVSNVGSDDKTQGRGVSVAANGNGGGNSDGNNNRQPAGAATTEEREAMIASGANPDDWYEDASGQWKRRH